MKNIFEVLYNPTKVFERLDNLYEEDLDSNNNFNVSMRSRTYVKIN